MASLLIDKLDDLIDPSHIKELEASFGEVVRLSNAFQDLFRHKLSQK